MLKPIVGTVDTISSSCMRSTSVSMQVHTSYTESWSFPHYRDQEPIYAPPCFQSTGWTISRKGYPFLLQIWGVGEYASFGNAENSPILVPFHQFAPGKCHWIVLYWQSTTLPGNRPFIDQLLSAKNWNLTVFFFSSPDKSLSFHSIRASDGTPWSEQVLLWMGLQQTHDSLLPLQMLVSLRLVWSGWLRLWCVVWTWDGGIWMIRTTGIALSAAITNPLQETVLSLHYI